MMRIIIANQIGSILIANSVGITIANQIGIIIGNQIGKVNVLIDGQILSRRETPYVILYHIKYDINIINKCQT